jgi:Flp pilus assembly protein TadB
VTPTTYALATAVAVLVALAGLTLAVAAWRGWDPSAGRAGAPGAGRAAAWRARAWAQVPPAWRARYRALAGAAAVVGAGVWLLTGWPVQGLLAAAVVLAVPWIWHPGGSGKARIQRLEDLATWLQQVASLHAAGIALEQTIAASVGSAPVGLRSALRRLAGRLQAGWRPANAYEEFAAELDDGAADHVVLLLLTHAADRGAGLAAALKTLGRQVADDAAMLRRVDSERAGLRAEARWITMLLVALAAVVLSSSMGAAYRSPGGQAVLVVLAAGVVAVLQWMRRMATTAPDPRMLRPRPPAGPSEPTAGFPAAEGRPAPPLPAPGGKGVTA